MVSSKLIRRHVGNRGRYALTMLLILLLACFTFQGAPCSASETDARVEWQYRDNIFGAHPTSMQKLAGGNILMVINGFTVPKIIEITRDGRTAWRYEGIQANSARRLDDGSTLITDSGAPGYPFKPRILEVDRHGNTIWQHHMPSRSQAPVWAEKMKEGTYLVALRNKIFQLGRDGRTGFTISEEQLKTAIEKAGGGKVTFLNITCATELPCGHILIVDSGIRGKGRVLEISVDGKLNMLFDNLSRPIDALRLESGNTLILDAGTFEVKEYDRQGSLLRTISYRAVISELPVSNQWRAHLYPSGHFLLSLTYTNNQSLVVEINDRAPTVLLDGKKIELRWSPFLLEGRIFVPMEEVLTALGVHVGRGKETGTWTAVLDELEITITVDSRDFSINGQKGTLAAAPKLSSGQVYIPAVLLRDVLGFSVQWDSINRTVKINR